MKQYIDKSALLAEMERRILEDYNIGDREKDAVAKGAIMSLKYYIEDTLEVKEINNVWHDTRRTIPEDGSEQIICIKEDGLAVSTVGKIVNGTIKWAYLDDLLNTNSFNVKVKEVKEEPVSNDLEEAADKHLVEKGYLLTTNNGEHLAEVEAKGLFKAGAKWQKEQMITNACEWLRENKDHPLIGCEDPCLSGYLTDEFIEGFKKAMEDKL